MVWRSRVVAGLWIAAWCVGAGCGVLGSARLADAADAAVVGAPPQTDGTTPAAEGDDVAPAATGAGHDAGRPADTDGAVVGEAPEAGATEQDRDDSQAPTDQEDEPRTGLIQRASRLMDAGHRAVSSTVESVADRMDDFFQDQRSDEGYNDSRVRVRFGPRIAEGGRSKFKANGRIDLRLPAASRRLSLVLAGLTDRDDSDPSEQLDPSDNFVSAFRLFLLQRTGVAVNVDAGLRWRPAPDPIARLRGTWALPLDDTLIRPTQFFFWTLADGVGETTRVDVDHRFWRSGLGRVRTDVTWSEVSQGMELDASLNWFQTLTELSGYRIRLRGQGRTDPAWVMTRYEISARYRRAIHRDWLFIDLEPAIEFRRRRGYAASPGITVQLEILFGAAYLEQP
jgi:hypothetical protein